MKPTLLILAAGIGSRYGGVKQMDQIGPSGESIIDYSVYDAIEAGFGKVVFVINRKIEEDFKRIFNKKLFGRIKAEYVLQEIDNVPKGIEVPSERVKPWGTGHAVLVAKENIEEPFAVINADDFYGRNAFQLIAEHFKNLENDSTDYCMVGYQLGKTLSEHGTVSRGICSVDTKDSLKAVVERTAIQRKHHVIGFTDDNGNWDVIPDETYVSMNFWGFAPGIFDYLEKGFEAFIKQNIDQPKAEYYIPSLVSEMIYNNHATVKVLKTQDQWFGVTYKEDKETTINKIKELVDKGDYPTDLWKL